MESKYRIKIRDHIERKYRKNSWKNGLMAAAALTIGSHALNRPALAYAAERQPMEMVCSGLDISGLEGETSLLADEGVRLEEQITKEAFFVPRTMVGDMITEQAEEACARPPVIPCSVQDYDILLRIVEAEAGICDYQGKVLVANVVINRVKSGGFPSTVTDVVYQKNQFSPVRNGALYAVSVSPETQAAVNAALAGEDYSGGALFFAARARASTASMRWFDTRLRFLFEHGGHEFFALP